MGQQTLCCCGYDRFGLGNDERCPECGQIQISRSRFGKMRRAMGDSASITAVISLVLSFITLAISVIISLGNVVMIIMLANRSGGFGAPIGLILPVYAYLVGVLPLAGITALLAIIPTKGKHWPLALNSLALVAVSTITPVVVFGFGLLFI